MSPPDVAKEIESRLGRLPGFFKPALGQPILASLWEQAKACYLDNPAPALFKEKLLARLSPLLLLLLLPRVPQRRAENPRE